MQILHRPRRRRLTTVTWLPVAIALLATIGCASQEFAPAAEESARAPSAVQWELTWQDEFDGPLDALPDPMKWGFDVGGGGWGNNQLEYDTDRPENASTDGEGLLRITAREESYGGREYTSARMLTRGRFQQEMGRFEARIKLPTGSGIWPAFWMLGADHPGVSWPHCGEIDIMEYLGQNPTVVHGSLHGPGYSGATPISESKSLTGGERFDDDFHTFAIEWTAGRIAWLLDDVVYHVATTSSLPPGTDWVFDHPFFMILNVAVGGHWPGPPTPSTTFPQTMWVDWVRVYQRVP